MAGTRPDILGKRYLRWPLEAAGFYLALAAFAALPVDTASNLGGWLGRTIGPRSGLSRRAERNLRLALPEADTAERARIIHAMWDNLGRTMAEYAHLGTISDPAAGRIQCHGLEDARAVLSGEAPAVAFSGHLANWEVLALIAAREARTSTAIVREPNNPLVDRLLERRRRVRGGRRAPKGAVGARIALETLRNNGLVSLLVDQRMSDGIALPFFGHSAMTAPAAAQLALRFAAPLYPVRLERTGPARFRLTVLPPLPMPAQGSRSERVAALMSEANRILEGWIRERPEQWLWLHRRWPREAYRTSER